MSIINKILFEYNIDYDMYRVVIDAVYAGKKFHQYIDFLPEDLEDMDAKTLLWMLVTFQKNGSELIQKQIDEYKKEYRVHEIC